MLKRGEVYFASPNELNDAQECRPQYIFNGSKEVWERFFRYLLSHICSDYNIYSFDEATKLIDKHEDLSEIIFPEVKKKNVSRDTLEALIIEKIEGLFDDRFIELEKKKIKHSIKNFMRQRILSEMEEPRYIASFSKTATNPTMWGHYSNADSGYVIIYSSQDDKIHVKSKLRNLEGTREKENGLIEIGSYQTEKLPLKEVEYMESPSKINAFSRLIPEFSYTEKEEHYDVPLLLPAEISEFEEEKFGLYKSKDWKYEKEIRAFFPAYRQISSQTRALEVQRRHFKGIVFGTNMSPSDKKKAIIGTYIYQNSDQDLDSESDIFFFNAAKQMNKFKLKIHPLGKLDEKYYGSRTPITLYDELDENTRESIKELAKKINTVK